MPTTAAGIVDITAKIMQGVTEHEDLINTISSLAGVGPEVALAEKAIPAITAVLNLLEQETGKSPMDVFQDFLNHITPGQPNSPTLTEAS